MMIIIIIQMMIVWLGILNFYNHLVILFLKNDSSIFYSEIITGEKWIEGKKELR